MFFLRRHWCYVLTLRQEAESLWYIQKAVRKLQVSVRQSLRVLSKAGSPHVPEVPALKKSWTALAMTEMGEVRARRTANA